MVRQTDGGLGRAAVDFAAKEPDRLVDRARQAYSEGQLATAARLCEKILAESNRHLDALNLMAAIEIQRDRTVLAMQWLERAIRWHPNHFAAHYNRAYLLEHTGQADEALAGYQRAIECKFDHLDAYLNLGNVLQGLGRLDESAQAYLRAIELQPQFALAYNNLGNTLLKLGRHDEALTRFGQAIARKPDLAAAHTNLADLLLLLKRPEEALPAYERALQLRPRSAETINNLGNALLRLARYEEALARFLEAIRLRPNYESALANRAYTLQKLARFDEALAASALALENGTVTADTCCVHAGILDLIGRSDEALAVLDDALRKHAGHARALLARGVLLQDSGRHEEALACYRRVLDAQPDNADAHWNLALFRLLHGDYREGWKLYEWRWRRADHERPRHHFEQAAWSGEEDIRGRTILLYGEQGFGDAIMFARFALVLEARGARVVLEVAPALVPLLRAMNPAIAVIGYGDPLPQFDVHCALMSLPYALGTTLETLPAPRAYLAADAVARERWTARLGPRRRPRIGLAWSGRRDHWNDHRRSVDASLLLPLLATDFEFHCLQKDSRAGDAAIAGRVKSWREQLTQFSETAALVDAMDLVVTVDTALAHLAGALGKPCWVLLPHAPEYRWMLGRTDSPWYPSMRLFRQSRAGDWPGVIGRVLAELAENFTDAA
jgi:tetratricopeptide (TPR) repeat protein